MEQRAEITYVWEQGLTNKRKVYHLTAKGKMRLQNLSTRIELEGV
jgi:DNA-binding PadR family transcriptional regulator